MSNVLCWMARATPVFAGEPAPTGTALASNLAQSCCYFNPVQSNLWERVYPRRGWYRQPQSTCCNHAWICSSVAVAPPQTTTSTFWYCARAPGA